MNKKEFKQFILSIGFKYNDNYNYYNFYNGHEWVYDIDLNDLRPLKKFTRSIKLKELLR